MVNELIIFDFDGTLIKRDSYLPLVVFLIRKIGHYYLIVLFFLFYLLFKINLLDTFTLKRIFAFVFLKGRQISQIRYLTSCFWKEKFSRLVDPEIMKIFQNSLNEGKRIIIISASFGFVVEEFCKILGVSVEVLATPAITKGDYFTGRIGEECKGKMKVMKLLELIGNRDNYFIEVFSDNFSDLPLFSIADRSYKIRKNRRIEPINIKGEKL